MSLLTFDLGGTSLRAAIYSNEGEELAYWKKQTSDFQSAQDAFKEAIASFAQHKLSKCAIGAPDIDVKSGQVRAHNLPWPHFNVKVILKGLIGIEPLCYNDADLQALALARELGPSASALVFTLGTGVGMGIVSAGKLFEGVMGVEGGHLYVGGERECLCGVQGHLEAYVGGAAILKRAKELGFEAPSIGPLADLARAGNAELYALFEEVGTKLGIGIASAVSTLGIGNVIISGGVAGSSDLFFDRSKTTALKYIFPLFRDQLHLSIGDLPSDHVGLWGAYCALSSHS